MTMSDSSSPTKRRRLTRSASTMKHMKGTQTLTWPTGKLPVEIFELIISYLPRITIQNMRLVSKEFEKKVSEYLFRVVVVPFKPEIYGITPEPTLTGASRTSDDMLQGSIMLQDKGMRVFQGFGRHILRFAMSFEFDETKLASPPIKSDQEAITTFWGIYRWPYKKYNRYTQLEGLEQTADETRTMAKALRFIECACELGLSIDGGLGWLAGPDINQKFVDRGEKVAVFGGSRFVPEEKPKTPKSGKGPLSFRYMLSSAGSSDSQHSTFERMLQEAGYRGENLEHYLRLMIETEEASQSMSSASWDNFDSLKSASSSLSTLSPHLAVPYAPPNNSHSTSAPTFLAEETDEEEEEEDEDDDVVLPAVSALRGSKAKAETYLLKPNDLTSAQREMLLEIEWAQRAFMQSYAIAIIDNPVTFKNIRTLTIARLPNRHLPILRREDFWDSLPQLDKLSLAIIPDWREVVKLPTSWVQDIKLAPSQSVTGVFKILHDQIARRTHIKTLHLEWICGGEEAPGLFARNQHILAAPVVANAMDMVNRARVPDLLSLPYVEHLSLKNCWFSPHILIRFGLSCTKDALQSLTLNSVSLTAPLAPNAHPSPVTGHAANAQQIAHAVPPAAANNVMLFQGMAGGQQPAHQPPPQPPALPTALPPQADPGDPLDPVWLHPPRFGSWAQVVDTLTPGQTLAAVRHLRDLGPEPPRRKPNQFKRLKFISCGYVRLPLDFDQTVLDAPDAPAPAPIAAPAAPLLPAAHANGINNRISDLEPFMMKPHDFYLGTIINHIDSTEIETLENAWNMTIGWGSERSALALEAQIDGFSAGGQGRFNGVVECVPTATANTS